MFPLLEVTIPFVELTLSVLELLIVKVLQLTTLVPISNVEPPFAVKSTLPETVFPEGVKVCVPDLLKIIEKLVPPFPPTITVPPVGDQFPVKLRVVFPPFFVHPFSVPPV